MEQERSAERIDLDKFDNKLIEGLCNYNRFIPLYSEIDEESSEEVNNKIKVFNWKDPKLAIILEINSCGGNCIDGLSIIDSIISSPAPVVTVITGMAASMASLISVVGAKRLITPNAFWMAHPMTATASDYLPYMKDHFAFLNVLNNRMEEVYKKYTKLLKADYARFYNGELWLTADECMKKGIVDGILNTNIQIARSK